jgi:hypothetical protein
VNKELERILMEVVVDEFEALSWRLPGEIEEITNTFSHGSRSPGRGVSSGPPEYGGVLLYRGVRSPLSETCTSKLD